MSFQLKTKLLFRIKLLKMAKNVELDVINVMFWYRSSAIMVNNFTILRLQQHLKNLIEMWMKMRKNEIKVGKSVLRKEYINLVRTYSVRSTGPHL